MKINESMVSNFHEFNNCGSFTITIEGTVYEVRYYSITQTIETDAPEDIKEAIRAWWFA